MAPITDWKLSRFTQWLPAGLWQFAQPDARRVAAWMGGILASALLLGWTLRLACLTGDVAFALVLCVAAAAAAMAFRWWMVPAIRSSWGPFDWAKFSLPSVVLMLAAILFTSVSSLTVLLVLAVLLGAEAASWSWALRFDTSFSANSVGSRAAEHNAAEQTPSQRSAPALHHDEELEEGLIQQVTRLREDDREIVRGIAKAEFQPGQRRQTIHLAFCPQLAELPEFFVEPVDGPEARVQTADLQPFGARLEITLPTVPEAAESVVVEFYGTANA